MTSDVVIAYLHPGEVAHSFHESMRNLMLYDLGSDQRVSGVIAEECGAARISDGRNSATRKFLGTDAQWLLFADADMGWDADALDRLLEVADPTDRPIVGGLCFALRKGPSKPGGARHTTAVPTIFRWMDNGQVAGAAPVYDYPHDTVTQCDATGAAFILIHRSVLEKLAEVHAPPREWWSETIHRGVVFGEDLMFCRRAVQAGFPIHVHTGVKTTHYKHGYLDEQTAPGPYDHPTYVVIPVKDNLPLTLSLLDELGEQGQHDAIFVMDNGSTQQNRDALVNLNRPDVEVFDAAGLNIHEMWNRGMDEATRRGWPCNVAILNNDLNIGPDFLSGLTKALRADLMLGAVCPNYDGRPGTGVEQVTEICAGRYDGTGGLAGFAFVVKGESGYRFPEELAWWFGDNDMLNHILLAGSTAGIVLDTTVEHVDGGSQTGDWTSDEMAPQLAADREWFEAKWAPALEEIPA